MKSTSDSALLQNIFENYLSLFGLAPHDIYNFFFIFIYSVKNLFGTEFWKGDSAHSI